LSTTHTILHPIPNVNPSNHKIPKFSHPTVLKHADPHHNPKPQPTSPFTTRSDPRN